MRELPSYYPVFLNIQRKKCVIIGGGQVALRKVKALLDAGAAVRVISPEPCPELNSLAENGKLILDKRIFQKSDLKEALIAIAATNDNNINLEVAREAIGKGILVNVVDDPSNSNFIAPSCLRRGDITIAISTGGRSPALARKIRISLEKKIENEYGALALLIDEVRMEMRSQCFKVDSEDWQEAIDLDLMVDLLKQNKRAEAKTQLVNKLVKLEK